MTTTTTLCIARHGETDWNNAGILQGWTDVPINDTGRRQARELAAAVAGQGFSGVYSSPLSRALETAQIIARCHGLAAPQCHEGLKERHFGIVQGVPKAELSELNPVLYQQIARRNPACRFDGGESMDDFAARVLEALKDIAARHPGARILAITHGWVMDVVTRHVGGLPPSAILPLKRKNIECLWVAATPVALRAQAAAPAPEESAGP